jgi:hypothetical protein
MFTFLPSPISFQSSGQGWLTPIKGGSIEGRPFARWAPLLASKPASGSVASRWSCSPSHLNLGRLAVPLLGCLRLRDAVLTSR